MLNAVWYKEQNVVDADHCANAVIKKYNYKISKINNCIFEEAAVYNVYVSFP